MLKQPLKTVPQVVFHCSFVQMPSFQTVFRTVWCGHCLPPNLASKHLCLAYSAPTTLASLEFTESTSDLAASGLCAHCFLCLEYSSLHFLSAWFFLKLLVWANISLSLTNTSKLPSPDILFHGAQLLKQRILELGSLHRCGIQREPLKKETC